MLGYHGYVYEHRHQNGHFSLFPAVYTRVVVTIIKALGKVTENNNSHIKPNSTMIELIDASIWNNKVKAKTFPYVI